MRRLDQPCRTAANRMQETLAAFPVECAGNVVELEAHVLPLEFRVRALAVDDELVAKMRALVVIEIRPDRNRLPAPDGIGSGGGRRDRNHAVVLQLGEAEAIVGVDDRVRRILPHVLDHVEAHVDPQAEALRTLERTRRVVEVGAGEDRNLAAEADLPGQARAGFDRELQLGNPRRKRERDLRCARLCDQRIEVVAIAKPLVAPVARNWCRLRGADSGAEGRRAILGRRRLRLRKTGHQQEHAREYDGRTGNTRHSSSHEGFGRRHAGLVTPRTVSQRITPARGKTNAFSVQN